MSSANDGVGGHFVFTATGVLGEFVSVLGLYDFWNLRAVVHLGPQCSALLDGHEDVSSHPQSSLIGAHGVIGPMNLHDRDRCGLFRNGTAN